MHFSEDINFLQNAYRSNFYITIPKSEHKITKEYISYYPANGSPAIKYNCDFSTTLLDILNNSEYIITEILSKYRQKLIDSSFETNFEILELLNALKNEILKTNNHFYILTMYIDNLIFEIKENETEVSIANIITSCIQCIFSLIEELQINTSFALAPYFRTFNFSSKNTFSLNELTNNKYFRKNAFETFTGNELYLPRVTLIYDNQEIEDYSTKRIVNRRGNPKKELISCKYSIFSLADLVNTTLYHLQCSDKAILCCSYCGKYFIPKEHTAQLYNNVTGNDEEKDIIERNSRMTCSKECSKKMKNERTKLKNSTGYRHELKSLRIVLNRIDKKYSTDLRHAFEIRYSDTKKKLELKYGITNTEIIEEKLLKFMLKEKGKMKQKRQRLKNRK